MSVSPAFQIARLAKLMIANDPHVSYVSSIYDVGATTRATTFVVGCDTGDLLVTVAQLQHLASQE